MSPHRHQDMDVVRKRLLAEYDFFCQHLKYIDPEYAESYFTLLENRFTDRPVLRGYYVDLMNRYIEGEAGVPVDLPEIVKSNVLPFVSEVLMTIMYYDNQILDKKAGVTTSEKINHNLLQGNILLSELYHYIEIRVEDELLAYQIVKMTREVYEVVCIGQEIEIKYNHIEAWEKNDFEIKGYKNLPFNEAIIEQVKESIQVGIEFPKEKIGFIDAYARRIYLTNAYLFERFTTFLAYRSELNHTDKTNITQFSGLYGITCQMVNDIVDLVPEEYNSGTKTKDGIDAFSDFRNNNITLPIALHLALDNGGLVYEVLKKQKTTRLFAFNGMKVCLEMIKNKSIQTSKKIAVKIKKQGNELLNRKNIYFNLIEDCLSIANGNRFYSILEKIEKGKLSPSLGKTQNFIVHKTDVFQGVLIDRNRFLLKTKQLRQKSKFSKAQKEIINWTNTCSVLEDKSKRAMAY